RSFMPSDDPILANPGDIVEEKVMHALPLTFSIHISKTISEHCRLECGLQYSLLKSKILRTTRNGNKVVSASTEQIKSNYIGIPLNIRYKFLSLDRVSFYSGMGGCVHVPLKGKLKTNKPCTPPVQWSVNGNLGVEYHLSPHIGFFAEPSINHYFKSKTEYPIIWQDKPFEFAVPIGVRFTW
ncbi:MAG: porin family protein, partial [Odoribacter sp.]|nr:porin family protein [Odoribacter sp.]